MFIGYFDETKRNITVEDQKSIVDSYINEHKINLDIVLSSSDFGFKKKRYIWEGKEEEIKNKLMSGMSRLRTAKEVGISIVSLYNYLKINPELKNITNGGQNA